MKKLCCVFWKIEAHISKYGRWHRITHLSCFDALVSSIAIGYGTGWVWRTLTQAIVLLESLSLLPEPPKCWDYRSTSPFLAFLMALKLFEKFGLGCSSFLELLTAVYRAWALSAFYETVKWKNQQEFVQQEAKQNKDSDSGEEQHCSFSFFPVVFVSCPHL